MVLMQLIVLQFPSGPAQLIVPFLSLVSNRAKQYFNSFFEIREIKNSYEALKWWREQLRRNQRVCAGNSLLVKPLLINPNAQNLLSDLFLRRVAR